MDTATPEANGHSPAAVTAGPTLAEIKQRAREDMEQLLGPLAARRDQLQAELVEVNGEIEEIRTTVAALDGRAAQKKKPKPSGSSEARGGPSQKMLDDVYAFIATCGQKDVIKDEICEAMGISQSTAMDALRTLRDQERIRLVGSRKAEGDTRTGGRAPSAYSVMTDE